MIFAVIFQLILYLYCFFSMFSKLFFFCFAISSLTVWIATLSSSQNTQVSVLGGWKEIKLAVECVSVVTTCNFLLICMLLCHPVKIHVIHFVNAEKGFQVYSVWRLGSSVMCWCSWEAWDVFFYMLCFYSCYLVCECSQTTSIACRSTGAGNFLQCIFCFLLFQTQHRQKSRLADFKRGVVVG